ACNPGNGCAGPVLGRLAPRLPFTLVTRFAEPDGSFPNGVPNPLLPENRAATSELVRESGADFGVAWDGDFDRCFLFDERGEFIEGYYIVGLLAQAVLRKHPGAIIMHDPRLEWNTVDIVESMGGRPWHPGAIVTRAPRLVWTTVDIGASMGGRPVMWKTGHAFIKEKMREVDAAYGGEMSSHHYFRAFSSCDSGVIPWLLIALLLSETGVPLSQLVAERIEKFPCSGEINRRLQDPDAALARLEAAYKGKAVRVDYIDGLSMEFDRWRFNVRKSSTEDRQRVV